MRKKGIFLIAIATVLLAATIAGCASAPAVKKGDNVTIDYIINSTDGKVYQTSYAQLAKDLGIYDASTKYVPYSFVVGSGTAIVGIDEAVVGMKVDETRTVVVPPEKSYGLYNQSLVTAFNLSDVMAGNPTLKVNDTVGVSTGQNGISVARNARVASIDAANNTVYLDFNRAHAGETLVIQVTVRKIQ